VGKRKSCSLSGRSPAPIADSSNVATIARKHSVLNLREINRNTRLSQIGYAIASFAQDGFNNNEELMEGVKAWLSPMAADFFDTGLQKRIPRYKCLNSGGDYVEK
jgi:hypothetical protein